ncbi:hypothetical protein ACFL1M_00795 [Patescibacteria group bacterium]
MLDITKIKVGDLISYHNRILKVKSLKKGMLVGIPVYKKKKDSGLIFNIPTENIKNLNVRNLYTKKVINDLLKTISEDLPKELVHFELSEDHVSKMSLEEIIVAIKGLCDEKVARENSLPTSKSRKLNLFIQVFAEELGAIVNLSKEDAIEKVKSRVDKRKKSLEKKTEE